MLRRAALVRNRRFVGSYRLHREGDNNRRARKNVRRLQLLVTAEVVPSSPILFTLMIEAIRSSETSILKRNTLHQTPEDGILYSHRRENLKSYIALTGWTR
jgi:hypothetical protein